MTYTFWSRPWYRITLVVRCRTVNECRLWLVNPFLSWYSNSNFAPTTSFFHLDAHMIPSDLSLSFWGIYVLVVIDSPLLIHCSTLKRLVLRIQEVLWSVASQWLHPAISTPWAGLPSAALSSAFQERASVKNVVVYVACGGRGTWLNRKSSTAVYRERKDRIPIDSPMIIPNTTSSAWCC